jgi:hypothetical protein
MPKGPKWTDDEKGFLSGILQEHGTPKGNNFNGWSDEVKAMVQARLSRSTSSIYQQIRGQIKARKDEPVDTDTEFILATGA